MALTITIAVGILCFTLFLFGTRIFSLFGITLDAFRVGSGALLFLLAVQLINAESSPTEPGPDEDFVVVPLAMPVIVGPATVGALMVMGAEMTDPADQVKGCVSLLLATLSIGLLLASGVCLERVIGKKGIHILSRITALVLAALSAQMILTGIKNFFVH